MSAPPSVQFGTAYAVIEIAARWGGVTLFIAFRYTLILQKTSRSPCTINAETVHHFVGLHAPS